MRYVITAPTYNSKSAGLMVLYELQKWLIRFGKDAVIMNFNSPFQIEDEDIVIYPEIVSGNPLKAKKVVRYILNEPGKLGGDKIYDKNEILVAYDDTLAKYSNGAVLRVPHIEEYFSNRGYERTLNCYWVGKGKNTYHSITNGCIEITYNWPAKRKELAELLNRTKILYTYDDRTSLSTEAMLCGCEVKIIENNNIVDHRPLYAVTIEDLTIHLNQFIALTWKESAYSVVEAMDVQINERLKNITQIRNEQIKVSVIIPLYNQLEYTKECFDSIKINTLQPHEIIFVNNGSTDNTINWVNQLIKSNSDYKLINNEINLGFPKAVNQGINSAAGKYILIANNDILVTPGWLERMVEVAESNPEIGLVGPISNSVSGVQLDKGAAYKSIPEMKKYAKKILRKNSGKVASFPRVAFLCTLIKKEVIDKIGGLDERYTPGNFEDDDFCLRAQIAGYKTVIAQDVFIHHYGSKSFKANGVEDYKKRLEHNKQVFIDKWGSDPNEIWLNRKPYIKRSLVFPIDTNIYTASMKRAMIYLEDRDYHFALHYLGEAIGSYDKYSKEDYGQLTFENLLNLAANTALIINDNQTAHELFEKELKTNPSSSRACSGLGETFLLQDKTFEAKTLFEWAVKNDPQNYSAIKSLEKVNQFLGFPVSDNSLVM